MARGGKRGHKGGTKRFTNPQALAAAKEKEEKEKAWRRARGEESSSEEEEEANDASDESGSSDDDGVAFQKEKVQTKKKADVGAGAKAESTSDSSEEDSSSDEERKAKGVEGLIEIENPNLQVRRQKKVTELDKEPATGSKKPELTRREREEIDKQKAKANYQKLHAAGKTEEARGDLARLAIIRKQREDAAKKRDEDLKAKEAALQGKKDSTDKALGKKK